MFTPFAFVKTTTTGGGGRTDLPPYNPVAYYDGSNTTVGNATNYIPDVVSLGTLNNFYTASGQGYTVNYTSPSYWSFEQPDRTFLSGSVTSSFLNSMGNREHTIVMRVYTTRTVEDDLIGNFTDGGIMSMFYGDKYRAHVVNVDQLFVLDTADFVTENAEIFVGQRFKNTGGGQGQLNVFIANNITDPMTKTTQASSTATFGGTGSSILNLGAGGRSPSYDGRIYKVAIYDTALTDAQIEDVRAFMD